MPVVVLWFTQKVFHGQLKWIQLIQTETLVLQELIFSVAILSSAFPSSFSFLLRLEVKMSLTSHNCKVKAFQSCASRFRWPAARLRVQSKLLGLYQSLHNYHSSLLFQLWADGGSREIIRCHWEVAVCRKTAVFHGQLPSPGSRAVFAKLWRSVPSNTAISQHWGRTRQGFSVVMPQ